MEARNILNDADLDALRSCYDRSLLVQTASKAVLAGHLPSQPFVDSLVARFFGDEGALEARDRELILIGLFATRGHALFLGVHIYWGLMEGLSPSAIADALLLTGVYQGLPVFADAIKIMGKTCTVLKELLTDDGEVPSSLVIPALLKALS